MHTCALFDFVSDCWIDDWNKTVEWISSWIYLFSSKMVK